MRKTRPVKTVSRLLLKLNKGYKMYKYTL